MNILQERSQFYHRKQQNHESIEQFATEISRLAASCRFEAQTESLIRDRVLFGLKSKKMTEQIIRNGGDPMLDEIIEFCIEEKRKSKPEGKENTNRPSLRENSYNLRGLRDENIQNDACETELRHQSSCTDEKYREAEDDGLLSHVENAISFEGNFHQRVT